MPCSAVVCSSLPLLPQIEIPLSTLDDEEMSRREFNDEKRWPVDEGKHRFEKFSVVKAVVISPNPQFRKTE